MTKIPREQTGRIWQGQGVDVVRKTLAPGGSIPAHSHPQKNVLVILVRGELRIKHNDSINLTAGELATFPGDIQVSLQAGQAGAEFLVFLLNHGN